MKPNSLFSGFCLGALLFLSSCTKDAVSTADSAITADLATGAATAENLSSDDNTILFEATASRNVQGAGYTGNASQNYFTSCATITVSTSATYFKIITLDFGTGCTAQGVVRSGKFIISLTDSLRNPGSKAVITFENYRVNNYQREGVITYTNQSTAGVPTWERKVENGKITSPNNLVRIHNGVNVIAQTAGVNTPFIHLDDEFTITGTNTVTNGTGISVTAVIGTPLLKKANCAHIVSGTKTITRTSSTVLLNYGDGTCDNVATISINGNTPIPITLP